jgi:multidrug efflux pump subunit AcrA (membrane-fusion protein)
LSELHYREGEWVRKGAVIGALDTFALQKELAQLSAREAMLRVEVDITSRSARLVDAQRAGEAAEAAASVPQAQVAVQEAGEVQHYRLREAGDRVAEAQAVMTAARQKASRLRNEAERTARGDYPPALAALRERIEAVRVEVKLAEGDLRRYTLLAKDGAIAPRVVDETQARLESLQTQEGEAVHLLLASEKRLRDEAEDAEAELARAVAAYRAAQSAFRQVERSSQPVRLVAAKEELRARQQVVRAAESRRQEAALKLAEGRLRELERERVRAQIALTKRRIAQSRIVADASGVVATPKLEQRLGRQFAAGEAICTLDLTGQLQVRVFVDERDVAEVRRGASVQLKVAAFPERVFAAEVREIVRRSLTVGGRNSYEVRLRVTNPGGRLMPGMTGWARIRCGSRSWGALLARRAVRYVRTEAWSWF